MSEQLLQQLNKILSLEYAGVVQYLQQSFLVSGTDRVVFADFFRDQSKSAHKHAETIGDKIVSLGGIPTVEPATIHQSNDLHEMLQQALQLERDALEAYIAAWELAGDNRPLKFMLESIIQEEQLHVEDLEKIAAKSKVSVSEQEKEIKLKRA
ncbi:MAG: ferritin-like domain-containing protein [Blastocatellia bacterium]|nr:ferritin-like domain-containing protein [Blastocatellia bacterium]